MALRTSKDRHKITRSITTTQATIVYCDKTKQSIETDTIVLIGNLTDVQILKAFNAMDENRIAVNLSDVSRTTKLYARTLESFIDGAEILGEVES